jgi:diguanylate cyclase (GGDEF)-like protein
LWEIIAIMYRSVLSVLLVALLFSGSAFAGPTSSIPNWFKLEKKLFETPTEVLSQLTSLTIDSWTDKQKVQYFDLLAGAYLVLSEYELAREALNKGWVLKERAEPYTLVNMISTKAYFKEIDGDLEGAEADYHTALRVAEQSGSFDAMLVALNGLISYYSFTEEQYERALEFVERASIISKSVMREFLVGDLHNYFGSILSYLGDTEGAFKQYEIAESIYQKLKNNVSLSNMLYNRALLHDESEEYIPALRTYEAFIEKAELWGDPTAQFFGNMGKANSYSYLERYELAYSSIIEAQEALGFIVDNVYLFDFWSSLIYIAADVERFELAETAINEAESLVERMTESEETWYHSELLNGQKYVAKIQGDYENAFEYSESLRYLQYDLMLFEQEEAINLLRINSENAMYQSETDRLAAESRNQQEIIGAKNQIQQILMIVLVMFAVSIAVLVITLQRKARQMRILQQYSAISESVKTSGQRVMENVASLMFDQSERRKAPLSVVIFDFSSMQDVREQFGEQAVDDSNKWIKETLEAEMREEDKCGQLTFGRYMLLLPGAEARVAKKQSDRLITFFKEHEVPGWKDIHLEVSVGISERSRHDRNPNVLTHRASTAVDIARDHGVFSTKVLAV